ALVAHTGEAHDGLGLVVAAEQLEHDALAPLAVDDVVADSQPEPLAPTRAGRRHPPRPFGGLHDAGTTALTHAALAALHQGGEVLGDLLEEAAGRVVLGRAEQHPAPCVREMQALARSCDPHVAE